jgi:hypothetical protein
VACKIGIWEDERRRRHGRPVGCRADGIFDLSLLDRLLQEKTKKKKSDLFQGRELAGGERGRDRRRLASRTAASVVGTVEDDERVRACVRAYAGFHRLIRERRNGAWVGPTLKKIESQRIFSVGSGRKKKSPFFDAAGRGLHACMPEARKTSGC